MLNSIVNTLGLGSGLDVGALVRDLAAASRVPKVQALDARTRTAQTRISVVAQARADLDSFAATLSGVVARGTLRTQPTVSDANAVSATAGDGARLGSFSADLDITKLARGQSVYSGSITNATDPIGQGGLTLRVDGQDFAITVDGTNDSLGGLASAINASASGVTATVVSDPSGARLVLKGESGAAKAFTLSAQPGAEAGLNRFTYAGAGSAMTQAQVAQDAEFTLDGIPYTRATNSFSDVITGVTLTLKKAAPGTIIAVGTQRPTDAIKSTVADFVTVFNQLKRSVAEAREATGGDQSLRSLEQQLGRFISQPLTSNPAIKSLSDIGVSTNRDGTISVDTAKLDAVLARDPDAVEAIFSPSRDALRTAATDPGLSGAFDALSKTATAPNGNIASLASRLNKEAEVLTKERERLEVREAAYEARLQRQFGNVDARVGALRATQSYLDQQIAIWTRSN
jgi:flagellar hook-associated protein 2